MKYLYPYECEKMKLSNPAELQCAIDGNRREGRRSSYGTYGDTVQPPLLPLQNLQSLQNLQNLQNPLSLVPRPQLNGNGNGSSHPLAPQDYLLGELALPGTLWCPCSVLRATSRPPFVYYYILDFVFTMYLFISRQRKSPIYV